MQATFAAQVQATVGRYCLKCHSGAEPTGELDLGRFADATAALAEREPWLRVMKKLRAGEMPPEDEAQPTAAERAAAIDWIERQIAGVDCSGPREPGRVTIRRLNRYEYRNTIRDLVGVDFKPAANFPGDDVGYGFDNIGDVLSLPPLLFDKYLAAAQEIVDEALGDEHPLYVVAHVEAESLDAGSAGKVRKGWHRLTAEGELTTEIDLPADGQYVLRARAYGQQAGDEPAKMAFRIDGQDRAQFDVTAVENRPELYAATLPLAAGKRQFAVAFLNDYTNGREGKRRRDRDLAVDYLEIARTATPAEWPEPRRRILGEPPAPGGERAWARAVLERFASRAFRRPAGGEQVERLARLVELATAEGDSLEAGIRLALSAALVSPHFLYRIERDPEPNTAEQVRALDDFEVATRLSYFLWSSMPDDELWAAATAGTLCAPDRLEAQVRRMLADAKAQALVENFAGQWLQLRLLRSFAPDKKLFPSFSEELRGAMIRESELAFAAVVREDRSVLELLDADYTYLNGRLARHYGIEGVEGDEFRRVALADRRRGGVLTHASVLAVTSNPTRTSPVKRGKWVLENLLGAPPPPPPANVPELAESAEAVAAASLRERLVQHRAKAECAVCHDRMDPLGFGLENYDAIGAWRTQDGPFAVDAAGELPGGVKFSGPEELKGVLVARQREFIRCLAEKLLTYALGRGMEYYDRCTIEDVVAATEAHENRFTSLVMAIVTSEPFLKRRGKGA